MSKKLTTEEFIIKAKGVHGDKYDYSKVDYVNNHIKVTIICPIHGIFEQTPSNHLQGKNCINCGSYNQSNTIKNKNISFEESRNFVRNLNLKSQKEWNKYIKSGNKPDNIPSMPNRIYKNKGWISMGDWLGTFTIASYKKIFLPFEEARIFARNLNLNSQKEWLKYRKSDNKPDNIPSNPYSVYKNDGWLSWGDWLGTKNDFNGFLPFDDARNFARNLNLKPYDKWKKYCKSGNKPNNIPSSPDKVYKNKGWIDFGDWLGYKKDFLSFEEARTFVRNLNLKSQKEWIEYCKLGNMLDNIPSNPQHTYKNKGWISWGDWLGTFTIYKNNFLPFEEARIFARNLNLKYKKKWIDYCKYGNKPNNIPSDPYRTYKNNGWVSFGNWLGTEYLSEEEFQQFIIDNFSDVHPDDMNKFYEIWWNDNQPINLPKYPKEYYNK
jgi:hypothetical protein